MMMLCSEAITLRRAACSPNNYMLQFSPEQPPHLEDVLVRPAGVDLLDAGGLERGVSTSGSKTELVLTVLSVQRCDNYWLAG